MAYQPLERLLPAAGGNSYRLILLASKRAMELADGQPPLIDRSTLNRVEWEKTATIALEEIFQGKVKWKGVVEGKTEEGEGSSQPKGGMNYAED